jgi:hypothetical protein
VNVFTWRAAWLLGYWLLLNFSQSLLVVAFEFYCNGPFGLDGWSLLHVDQEDCFVEFTSFIMYIFI